ncbi:hypothetical protein A9K55_007829 [Cordyceps militaris]|uniref:Uncharacterized protein n=1 Tax=Cordyceps militaris TaxID=73501 RepID=A0A2H4SKN0_CORMI|nr:hypothetical protein A9K55_007829 [Cordyceps militaris]
MKRIVPYLQFQSHSPCWCAPPVHCNNGATKTHIPNEDDAGAGERPTDALQIKSQLVALLACLVAL